MSLQEVSSLPPNKIVDERREGNRGGGYRSARRLSQLTQSAVDKALKLQAESGRLVDVVDTQSCGDPGEFGCLIKYPFSPSASKLLKNPTFLISSSSSRSWTLPKESQDRRTVTAKLYSLLIQWRSDVSLEWRSRVGLAVPVLEEALYRVAKCKEDYTSQQLLEHVLLHFEAGNGLFLLQGTKPLYPVRASHTASLMGQDTSEQINCVTVDSCEISPYDALPWENANALHANDLDSGLDSESCLTDNCASWDALELGHTTSMEVGLHKRRDNPGKRITKRVVNMLSKRSDNHRGSRHEVTKATHSEENIPSAGVRVDGAKTEMRNDGEFCEPSRIKQESPCYGDTRTRKSSRKTLGDMININLTNLPSSGSSLVDEARPLSEESNCRPSCSKHSDTVHSFCMLKADTLSTEAIRRPFPSSSNVAYSSMKLMQPSSDKAKPSTGSSSLQKLPMASMSSPSRTAALQLSPSPPKSKTSTRCPANSLSISAASPGPFSSLPPPCSLTLSSIALSAVSHVLSTSSSSSPVLVSSSYSASSSTTTTTISCASSSSRVSSLTSISHVSSSSSLSDVSSSSSSHTAQISISSPLIKLAHSSPPTEFLIQPLDHMPPSSAFLEGEQNQEFEEPMPTTAATSQEIETEAASGSLLSTTITATATASNDSSPEARKRGLRLPLSIFLSERDEFGVNSMAEISGDSVCSWKTWEEPTEQIDPLCCVCMVGLKGAAFIPCGHTFCRKCSRVLWRGRGACPLCNRYIREILDVY